MKNVKMHVAGLLMIMFISACSSTKKTAVPAAVNTNLTDFKFTVEEAKDWDQLFRRSSGWFGGDGIFAIPVSGMDNTKPGKRVILFSDTMIGEIVNDTLKPGFVMLHNSVAVMDGAIPAEKNIKFYWDKNATGEPESIFIPSTPLSQPKDYYWLGDGFVNLDKNSDTYIFGYRIRDTDPTKPFGFEQNGSTLIIIPKGSKPPYKDQRQIDFPFYKKAAGTPEFGSGIYVNTKNAGAINPDGYAYIYGIRGTAKNVVVARVKPVDFENFTAWRFWNGKDWGTDMNAVADIAENASNELSVSMLSDGRYAMFFQVLGVSSTVGMRIGASPVGPFGPVINVFDSKSVLMTKNFFPYNAKAHPSLSNPGELIVSYNVNSFDFFNEIKLYPNLYRPRFLRIKY